MKACVVNSARQPLALILSASNADSLVIYVICALLIKPSPATNCNTYLLADSAAYRKMAFTRLNIYRFAVRVSEAAAVIKL
eukprot:986068-Pleurochrysis_carterae.AAC.9